MVKSMTGRRGFLSFLTGGIVAAGAVKLPIPAAKLPALPAGQDEWVRVLASEIMALTRQGDKRGVPPVPAPPDGPLRAGPASGYWPLFEVEPDRILYIVWGE
jgi:hypothetical protein